MPGNVIDLRVADAAGVLRGPVVQVKGDPGIEYHFGDTVRLRLEAKVQKIVESETSPVREYQTVLELLRAQVLEVNP